MTYAEFCIRSYGYRRMQQSEWSKFRKVAFNALIAFNVDGKKLPKTEKQFMPLPMVDDDYKPQLSKEHIEAFIKATQQYKNNG